MFALHAQLQRQRGRDINRRNGTDGDADQHRQREAFQQRAAEDEQDQDHRQRGERGEVVEYQANVIASVLAERLSGSYKMLHLPDGLSQDSLHMLMTCEPQIKEIGDLISRTDVLLFGIGTAMRMADQRHIADDVRKQLVDNHAVGEALGQYCDIEGKLIYSTNNIGLSLPDVVKVPNVIAVAGGQEKASAIIGVMRACQKGILIIDEQAAEGMRQLLQISAL